MESRLVFKFIWFFFAHFSFLNVTFFRELRKDKNNVMTLIYAKSEGNNPIVCIEKKTNKLIFYHRRDDPSRFDVDKVSLSYHTDVVCVCLNCFFFLHQ